MHIILDTWDRVINTTLNPKSVAAQLVLSDEETKNLVYESALELVQVKKVLIDGIIDSQKVIDKQQYVRVVQGMLIRLLDSLHVHKHTGQVDSKLLLLYTTIEQHLKDCLDFIQDFLPKYFDLNEKVPSTLLLRSVEELRLQSEHLQRLLEFNDAVDDRLKHVLINNVNSFCSIESQRYTYKELLYQQELMGELLSNDVLTSEASIKQVLFYLNFNAGDFLAYLSNCFMEVMETLNLNKEKVSALRYEQKTINQFPTKLNGSLAADMPSLKEQVNNWIEEEIKYLQSEPSGTAAMYTAAGADEKIQTSLSVSKLALLIKIMVNDKIIINRVVAQMLRVVIRTVTSSQSENIGFSSLESKYHRPDKGTIVAVKDMLFRWINILNQL